jgi:hypothetical protein
MESSPIALRQEHSLSPVEAQGNARVSSATATNDRVCSDDEATGQRSLFCGLQKADTEVLGTYEYRNVALQEGRFAIEDATRDRQTGMMFDALRHFRLPHRLMDFDNLPDTRQGTTVRQAL